MRAAQPPKAHDGLASVRHPPAPICLPPGRFEAARDSRTQANDVSTQPHAIVSKISFNQIIRTSASANIYLGCGGTYQITVGIECVQKARFVGTGIRLNSPQCIFVYEK